MNCQEWPYTLLIELYIFFNFLLQNYYYKPYFSSQLFPRFKFSQHYAFVNDLSFNVNLFTYKKDSRVRLPCDIATFGPSFLWHICIASNVWVPPGMFIPTDIEIIGPKSAGIWNANFANANTVERKFPSNSHPLSTIENSWRFSPASCLSPRLRTAHFNDTSS